MSRCDAELCPYWGGHECLCEVFDIEKPGPDAGPLPSATYMRIARPSPAGDAAEGTGADGGEG